MGQVLAGILVLALGVAYLVAAFRPTLPGLRAFYWWSFLTRTRPIITDRIFFVFIGLVMIVFATFVWSSCRDEPEARRCCHASPVSSGQPMDRSSPQASRTT